MSRCFGIVCILLGVCCLLSAAGLVVYNKWDDKNAQKASQDMLQEIQQQIAEESDGENEEQHLQQMPVGEIKGYEYIGILTIPALEVELPVLTDWSYAKLKVAPCLYYGNCYEPDFVIAAHNYQSHFGRLSKLQAGDIVTFTDVSGNIYGYEVILIETLAENATKEMITSGFDLSLYTCTPGGGSRVTVRCNAVK